MDGIENEVERVRTRVIFFVVVDIDPGARALSDVEYGANVRVRIAIDDLWVNAADQLDTHLYRGLHQIRCAGTADQAGLGKRDQLNVDAVVVCGLDVEQMFDIAESQIRIDIDMTADRRRAVLDCLCDQP